MYTYHKNAFSLIELVVVIAVIAAIATITIPQISVFRDTTTNVTEERAIKVWNSTYQQLLAIDPTRNTDDWDTISAALAAGINVTIGPDSYTYSSPIPQFSNAGEPAFTPGTGITAAP